MTDAVKAQMAAWGRKGGKARKAALSPAERKDIARRGAQARWGKRKERKG